MVAMQAGALVSCRFVSLRNVVNHATTCIVTMHFHQELNTLLNAKVEEARIIT